jgi:hypothetical protein
MKYFFREVDGAKGVPMQLMALVARFSAAFESMGATFS